MDNPFVIRDIAPPIETLPDAAIWPWLAIPLLFLAGILLYRFSRKAEPEPPTIPPPPLVTPRDTALQALDALMSEKLIERGEMKLFFTKLNMILRVFLGGHLRMQALVQTTSEILRSEVYHDREEPVAAVREAADPPSSSAKGRPPEGGTPASASEVNLGHRSCTAPLASFLQTCDLFKFADVTAQAGIARNAHGKCRELVIAIAEEKEEA